MTRFALLAAAALALAGCASSGLHTTPADQRVVVGDTDNGRTVTLHRGEELVLRLHSTYWQVSTPPPGLRLASRKVAADLRHCVPGGGCGTVTAVFRATARGTTAVSARRTSCGEAMRCTGGNGSYDVTVVVD